MSRLNIRRQELDLLHLKDDVFVLEAHLRFAESQIDEQRSQSQLEWEEKSGSEYDRSDEVERAREWHDHQVHQLWTEEVLPRLVLNPFIVAVWSLHETAVTELASLLRKQKGVSQSLAEVKGKHFLARANSYFENTLGFPFGYTEERRSSLDLLASFRNAIAHSNGRMSGLKEELVEEICRGAVPGVWASEDETYFILEEAYVRSAFELVQGHLTLLFDRYEAS